MTAGQFGQFRGFSHRTFTFLADLGRHNDKAWFDGHRTDYEEHVLQPLRDLVTDLAHFMLTIDLSFEVTPAVGKTISLAAGSASVSPNVVSFTFFAKSAQAAAAVEWRERKLPRNYDIMSYDSTFQNPT